MGKNIRATRAAAAGVLAVAGAAWSKIGWLLVLWAACAALDFLTGCLAALHSGKWNSRVAHEGIWHKAGMIVIVLVAGLFDAAIRAITSSAGVTLPFEMLILPIVLAWYIITELGSMFENAVRMGAQNVPEWLKKGLAIASDAVEQTGEAATGGDGDGQDDK